MISTYTEFPKKLNPIEAELLSRKNINNFCKDRNVEIEYCTPRMHTGNGVVERSIQTMKNLILANLEDGKNLTESINRALRVMRFTTHTGLKVTPFELHHGRKPRTESTNIIKDGKTFLSNWSEMNTTAPSRPKKKQFMWAEMRT